MSAARVYLFVDSGKGPVVLARSQGGGLRSHNPNNGDDEATRWGVVGNDAHQWFASPATRRRVELGGYRAWWLVECESAEDGRALIEGFTRSARTLGYVNGEVFRTIGKHRIEGRILASGGAA